MKKTFKCYDDNWGGQEIDTEEFAALEFDDLNKPVKIRFSGENRRLEIYVLQPRHGNLWVLFVDEVDPRFFLEALDKAKRYIGGEALTYVEAGRELYFEIFSAYGWAKDTEQRRFDGFAEPLKRKG